LRSSLLTSLVVHAVFFGFIVIPSIWTGKPVMMQVLNVKLIAEEKPRPAPPAPKPEVVEEKKAPEPEKKAESKMTYKPEKKTTTKPVEKKAPAKTEKKTEPAKPSGSTAGSSVVVDDPDFKFAYYLEIIKERVGHNWSPPPISVSGNATTTVIYFRISKSGSVGDTKIEKKSGYDLFDKAAVRAVKLCDPLPPLPAGFNSRWLGVHFEFEQTSEQP
jgi:TonB family protein